jgi:hypothetical protein
MAKLATLPPVKNVDADMLKRLRARMPVSTALIVRTGLALLAAMPEGDYWDAIVKQAEVEQQQTGKKPRKAVSK